MIQFAEMLTQDQKMNVGRYLALWLGSFLVIGTVMLFYFHVPPLPVLSAGVLTLIITVARILKKKQHP